ncbi:MAG TPA: serine protease [Pilimelia sp.]|nr:serine protease [Pilimelia sp.]
MHLLRLLLATAAGAAGAVWAVGAVGAATSLAGGPAPAAPVPAPVAEVVGGVAVPAGGFPWVVRVSTGCGGSLVAPRVVLTAAHCVPPSGPTRRLLITAASTDLDSPRAVRVRSTAVRRAPGYRGAVNGDDWALVRLDRALDLPTVRLPADGSVDRGTFTVLGWGSTREGGPDQRRLRAAQLPFVSDAACAEAYDRIGYRIVKREMLCAGDLRRGGVDSCQGDSGGPLARRDGAGRWVQVGVVSWGQGCGRPRSPGVYTQLSAFARELSAALRASR